MQALNVMMPPNNERSISPDHHDNSSVDRFGENHFHLPLHVHSQLEAPSTQHSDADSDCTNPRLKYLMDRYFQSNDEGIEFVLDASNLDDRHKNYDLVFAGNLLDRLSDPESFLRSMQERLNPGGILVISSPYTLLEEFTPKENWLAEYDESGEYIRAFEGMRKILEPSFELAKPPVDVPFVIRETQRKFQHTVAELSVWRKA